MLPDATEVVVFACGARGYLLYRIEDWEKYEKRDLEADSMVGDIQRLEVDSTGQVLRYGRTTRWRVEDLFDTGRTA